MAGFICLIMILVSATVCSLAGYAVTGRHPKFCKLIWKTLAIILLFPIMALGILVAAFGFAYVICMRFASPMFDYIDWGRMLLLLFFSVMCPAWIFRIRRLSVGNEQREIKRIR